jgi:hypothetical protein
MDKDLIKGIIFVVLALFMQFCVIWLAVKLFDNEIYIGLFWWIGNMPGIPLIAKIINPKERL